MDETANQTRRLTLTFDNGPIPGVTDAVLDILARRDLKATFFVVGEQLRAPGARALAERAVAEGHWVGNHSMTHRVSLGQMIDAAGIALEIDGADELLHGLRHADRLFRPFGNGGVIDQRMLCRSALDLLQCGGYTVVCWNSIPRDWDDPDGWVARAVADVRRLSHTVVVLHDRPTGAMRHLDAFLDEVAVAGVDIVQDFPDDVVLLRRGIPTSALTQIPIAPQ
jgi:peptidoglycan-N-acetylglucosamine deacetylase